MNNGFHNKIPQHEQIKEEAENKKTKEDWQSFYRDQRVRQESIRKCHEIAEKARADVKANQ